MTRQKHSNPLKDPKLSARFARLLAKHMIRCRVSDEQLASKMNVVAGASCSVTTIRRHKDGSGGVPTLRMIGIYQKARTHLEAVSEWTRNSFSEQEKSFVYAIEEHAHALASLGALAFTSMDFAEARVQFGEALGLPNLPTERMDGYRQSYLISSNAVAARSNSEEEARAILREMEKKGFTRIRKTTPIREASREEAYALSNAILAHGHPHLGCSHHLF